MNELKLSKRLEKVASYVPKNSRLADIGSDHAYLPANLVLNKKIEFGIAGEVVQGPFDSAKGLINEKGLSDFVAVRFGDGLDVIATDDHITVVTIAGMGGSLIRSVLDRGLKKGKLQGVERLILQPNVGEKGLREWLVSNTYEITSEAILEEDGKFYEVIVAEKASNTVSYTTKELSFGPFLLNEMSDTFKRKWQLELIQRKRILKQMSLSKKPQIQKIAEVTQMINWIEELTS